MTFTIVMRATETTTATWKKLDFSKKAKQERE